MPRLCSVIDQKPFLNLAIACFVAAKLKRFRVQRLKQATGLFYPAFGLVLCPEIATLSMSDSSLLIAVNAFC
jgi:uncharacterized membrane protein